MSPFLQVVVFVLYVAVCNSAVIENDVQTLCQDRGRRGAAGPAEARVNYGGEPEVASDVPRTPLGLRDLNSAVGLPRFPSLKQKRCPSTHPRLTPRHVNEEDQIVGAQTPENIQRGDTQNEMTKRLCKNCQKRPLCSVYKKCDQCKRWCIEKEPSPNDVTLDAPTKFEIQSNDVPLISSSNTLNGEAKEIVSLPNRFRSASSESQSFEDDKLSLPTPNGDKKVYTIANFSSGPLKELICNLLGISNTSDIEKMVVWVTTYSNQPPKFAVEYKKNVSPLAEKLTDTFNDELKKALEQKKKQGGSFLTNEEMEDIAQKILATKPKDVVMAEKPSGARSSSSEDRREFPKDDFDFTRKVNPDVIEDTLDPKLLEGDEDNPNGPWIGSAQKETDKAITSEGNNLKQAMNAENDDDRVQSPMIEKLSNQLLTKNLMQQVKDLIDQRVKNAEPQPSYLRQPTQLGETEDSQPKDQVVSTSNAKQPDTHLTKKVMQQMKDSVDKRVKNPKYHFIPRLGSTNDIQTEDQINPLIQPEDVEESLSTPQHAQEEPQINLIGSEQATRLKPSSLDQRKGPIPSDLDPTKTIGEEPTVGDQNLMEEAGDEQLEDGIEPTNLIGASHVPEDGGLESGNVKPTPTAPITPADQLQDGLSKILQTLRKDSDTMPRIIKDFDTAKEVMKDVERIVDEIRKEANFKPDMGQIDALTLGHAKEEEEEPSSTPLKPLGPERVSTPLESIRNKLQQTPLSQIGQKLGGPKPEDIEDEKVGSQPMEIVPWDKQMTPSMMQRMNQRKNKDHMKLGSPISGELPEVDELADNTSGEFRDQNMMIPDDEVPIKQDTNVDVFSHDEEGELGKSVPDNTANVKKPTKDMTEEESDLKVTPLDKKEMTQLPLHSEASGKQYQPKLVPPPQAGEEEMVPQQTLLGQTPSAELKQMHKIKPIELQDDMRLREPNSEVAGNIEPSNQIPHIFPDQTMTISGKEVPLKQKTTVQSSPHAGEDETLPQQTLLGQTLSADLNQMKKTKPSGFQNDMRLREPNREVAGNIEEPSSQASHLLPKQPMTILGKEVPSMQKTNLAPSSQAGEEEMIPQQILLGQTPSDDPNQLKQIKPSRLQDVMRLGQPNMDDTENREEPSNHLPHVFPDQTMTISGKEVPLKQKTTVQSSPHAGEDEIVPQQTLLGRRPSADLNQMKKTKPSGLQDDMRLREPNREVAGNIEEPSSQAHHLLPKQPMTILGKEIPSKQKTNLAPTHQAGEDEMVPQQILLGQIPSDDPNELKQTKPSGLQDGMRLGQPNMDVADNIEEPSNRIPHTFPRPIAKIPSKQKATVQSSPHAGKDEIVPQQTLLGRRPSADLNQMKKTKPSGLQDDVRLREPNREVAGNIEEPSSQTSHLLPKPPMTIFGKVPSMQKMTLVPSPHAGEEEMVPQQTLLGQTPNNALNQLKQIKPSGLQDGMRLGKPNMDAIENNIEETTNVVSQELLDQTLPILGKEAPLKQKSTLKTSPQAGQEEMDLPNSLLGQGSPVKNQIHPKLTLPSRIQDIAERLNQDTAKLGSPNIFGQRVPIGKLPSVPQGGGARTFTEDPLGKAPNNQNYDDLESMNDPALQSRAEFSTVRSTLDEPSWSNSLGRLIPVKEDQALSTQGPKGMYFVGNGIKLPLQMVRNNEGDVHLSVDLDKLCTCRNNTLCSNNHTAMGHIVGTPLMKQHLVENESSNEKQAGNIEEDSDRMLLGMSAPKLEELEGQSNLVTPRIGRGAASRWLDIKNSIARQVNPSDEYVEAEDNTVFKRDATLKENIPEKVTIPLTKDEVAEVEKENINLKNSANEIGGVTTENNLESLHKFLNEKIMNLKYKVVDAERENELKLQQLEESEENLMNALSSFNKDTKPSNKLRNINNMKSLFLSRPLGLKSRFKGSSEEKDISNESHDILTPIKSAGNFNKPEDLQNKLDQFNQYVDKYNKESESLLKKDADVIVKTQKSSFIKKEVDMMNNILKFLKSVAIDKKE